MSCHRKERNPGQVGFITYLVSIETGVRQFCMKIDRMLGLLEPRWVTLAYLIKLIATDKRTF